MPYDTSKLTWPGWDTVRLIGSDSISSVYEIQRTLSGKTEKAALRIISVPRDVEEEIATLRSFDVLFGGKEADEVRDGVYEERIQRMALDSVEEIFREYAELREVMKGCSQVVQIDDLLYREREDAPGVDILVKSELLTPITAVLDEDLPEETARLIGMDLCKALAEYEKRGHFHGNIEPDSIFVTADGTYKLDLGLPRTRELLSNHYSLDSRFYDAPEIARGESGSPTADIYSLGMVLFWLLNRSRLPDPTMFIPPHELRSIMEIWFNETLRNPREYFLRALQRIVLKACALDPGERYQTPEEMLQALEASKDPKRSCPACGCIFPEREERCPQCHYSYLYPEQDGRGRRGRWEQDLLHCPGCGKRFLEKDDAFCRFCGRKHDGTPGRYFEPDPFSMEYIYGPLPATIAYACKRCGHRWTGSNWNRQYNCPKCGNLVQGVEEPE